MSNKHKRRPRISYARSTIQKSEENLLDPQTRKPGKRGAVAHPTKLLGEQLVCPAPPIFFLTTVKSNLK